MLECSSPENTKWETDQEHVQTAKTSKEQVAKSEKSGRNQAHHCHYRDNNDLDNDLTFYISVQ